MIDSVFWKKIQKNGENGEKKILQNQSYNLEMVNFPKFRTKISTRQALKSNCQPKTNDYSYKTTSSRSHSTLTF